MSAQIKQAARERYSHANVQDRYDADLLMAAHEFEEVILAPYVVRCAVCGEPKYPGHTDQSIGGDEE